MCLNWSFQETQAPSRGCLKNFTTLVLDAGSEDNSHPGSLSFLLLPELPISSSTHTFPRTQPTHHFEWPLILGTRRTQHPQGPGLMGQSDDGLDFPC